MKANVIKNESDRLSPQLLALLGTRGNVHSFKRGQLLIEEGDASDALYILVTGRLKVFTRDDKGRELVYNVLEPGEFFGELLLDGGVRSASVKAMLDSQCIVVHENEIRQFLCDYPEFAESLILKLIARVRHATQQVRSLALDGVYERIVTLFNEIVPSEHATTAFPSPSPSKKSPSASAPPAKWSITSYVIWCKADFSEETRTGNWWC